MFMSRNLGLLKLSSLTLNYNVKVLTQIRTMNVYVFKSVDFWETSDDVYDVNWDLNDYSL